MKIAKSDIHARKTCLPEIRFDDQSLTSFAGLIVFQHYFKIIQLSKKLQRCFNSQKNRSSYGIAKIVHWLMIHVILGFRKIRDIEYYKDDPMVKSTANLKELPDVSTVSRVLGQVDDTSIENFQNTVREECLDQIETAQLKRITLDFDGSVIGTNRYAEGTAVGFNRKKKGQRSYYPLFCTVAQTGQILDVLHRSGNVHDSHGAVEFIAHCVSSIRERLPHVRLEVRMDSAFFSDSIVKELEHLEVEYSISVPFERLCELKDSVENRIFWYRTVCGERKVQFFEKRWKPKSWKRKGRFLFIRQENPVQRREPVQLDLFRPADSEYEYKVIITNKTTAARHVVRFHEGRGQQENVFGELKSESALSYVPFRKWNANKIYLLTTIFAHNLVRSLQISTTPLKRNTTEKRTPLWIFENIATLRRRFIQRAGRLTRPAGQLTLTVTKNDGVQAYFQRYLAV